MNEDKEASLPVGSHAAKGPTASRFSDRRLWLSAGCVSAWLLFLMVGATLGGAVHLLLVAALWLRPWALRSL